MSDNPDSGAADKLTPAHPICCTPNINTATRHMLLKSTHIVTREEKIEHNGVFYYLSDLAREEW
jgi:hypothetical protein